MKSQTEELKTASRPRSNFANAAWNTIGTVTTIAVSFLTAPVLIRNLGTSDYGVFLLVGSITGVLSVMNFGLGEATLRYVARYYGARDLEGINRVFGSTLTFYAAMAATVSFMLAVATPAAMSLLSIQTSNGQPIEGIVRLTGLVFALRIFSTAYSMVPSALLRYDISSKVTVGLNMVRTFGYLGLATLGFRVFHLVMWDVALGLISVVVGMLIARKLLPGLHLLPSLSFKGLKETVGYGVFSFLTWAFHTMHRESGKLLLGRMLGTEPVAYLGAPDSMAQRLHMVVATGSEALIPGFSAGRDQKEIETTYWNALWSALSLSLILLLPFAILIPDFLRLWINEDFARQASFSGQLIALYLISQGAFAPVAAYYRGIGRPGYVTVTILVALIVTSSLALWLIPSQGVNGASWAYLGGSSAPFMAAVVGGFAAFGRSAWKNTLRMVLVPLAGGAAACELGFLVRGLFGPLGWAGFCTMGATLAGLTTLCIVGGDWAMGGELAPSRQSWIRLKAHPKLGRALRLIPGLSVH